MHRCSSALPLPLLLLLLGLPLVPHTLIRRNAVLTGLHAAPAADDADAVGGPQMGQGGMAVGLK